MRIDAARILMHMGHRLDDDFIAVQESRDSVSIKWLSDRLQPTEAEIEAAAPAALAALQAEADKRTEANLARDDVKRALSALDTIIQGIDAATLAQAKTAIKQLAQIQKHIILATVGR